jgi:NOL1/NOP2/fmu family ribosome biogenesis protein
MKILTSKEKKQILKLLEKQFGINNIPFEIIKFGEEKFRAFTGNISKQELEILDKELRIENCGLYFATIKNNELRLTIDGIQLFKDQITKNIQEINDKQANDWLKGYDLDIKTERGFKIIKHNDELIGCGKSTGDRITNFVPKERRIRN